MWGGYKESEWGIREGGEDTQALVSPVSARRLSLASPCCWSPLHPLPSLPQSKGPTLGSQWPPESCFLPASQRPSQLRQQLGGEAGASSVSVAAKDPQGVAEWLEADQSMLGTWLQCPRNLERRGDHSNEGGFAGEGSSDLGFDECSRVFYEEGVQGDLDTQLLCTD